MVKQLLHRGQPSRFLFFFTLVAVPSRSAGRQRGDSGESAGRQQGDSGETVGRQWGDNGETAGRQRGDSGSSFASRALTDYFQVEIPGSRYKSVNFGARLDRSKWSRAAIEMSCATHFYQETSAFGDFHLKAEAIIWP